MLDSSLRTMLGMFQAVQCITESLPASLAIAGRTSTTSWSLQTNQVEDTSVIELNVIATYVTVIDAVHSCWTYTELTPFYSQ